MTPKEVIEAYRSKSISQKEALDKIAAILKADPGAYVYVDEIIGIPSEIETEDVELARNWERNKKR